MIVVLLLPIGCNDILEEEPRALLTPDLFETKQGLEGGLIASYSFLRYFYGTEQAGNLTIYGTDEFTNGNQTTDPPFNTYRGITPDDGNLSNPWNRSYPAINTLNGLIELAPLATDLTEAERQNIVGEARFLRANFYFILVQTFGGVTLDFGSGPLKFNRTPSVSFERATLAETYQAIIDDLEIAVEGLADAPREPGRVWKASAYHLLAKAYLARGWSSASQGDDDFRKALEAAEALIPDPNSPIGNFGAALLNDYAMVFEEGNEYNSEVLLSANRIGSLDYGSFDTGNLDENLSNFLFRMFYEQFDGMVRDVENGRPWIRYKPTDWLLNQAFNQKDVDSRYHKSFQTVWYANDPEPGNYPKWSQADADAGYVDASKVGEQKFSLGDTAVWMLPNNINLTPAQIAAKGYSILTPAEISVNKGHFPSLSKYNAVLRPIPGTEDDPNLTSYRPYIADRFAETYLVAAEAAFKLGQVDLAADYINTIRRRAAYPGKETDMEITGGDVTIDFILDERSRELAGEQKRWYDLARTGKLKERAEAHNPDVTTVEDYHYLRPIPQSQRDLTIGDYPQNDGYN